MGSKSSDKNSSDPLPSTSSPFMTSTLFPAKRFTANNNNATVSNKKRSGRYSSMGTVGRSCVNTIKKSRQNVAIATQVLNPSAIGGSLKGRGAKHFGPPDDDEEEFITYRRTAAWKKLCYYGSAIVIVILILMAIILAVGYMQSEKHKRILSRSIKLTQERNPSSYIYMSTTPDPPSLEPTDSHEFFPTAQSSYLLSSRKDEDSGESNGREFLFTSGETSTNLVDEDEDDDYLNYNHNEDNTSQHASDNTVRDKNNKNPFLYHNNDHSVEDHDNEGDNRENNRNVGKGESQEASVSSSSETLDNDLDAVIVDEESVDDVNNNTNWKSTDEEKNTEGHTTREEDGEAGHNDRQLSEVKVLPPDDFVFSIEIPIYTPNNSIRVGLDEKNTQLQKEIGHQSSLENNDDDNGPTPLMPEDEFEQPERGGNGHSHDQSSEEKQVEGDPQEFKDEESVKESSVVQAEEKQDFVGDDFDNSRFHAILHTALFEDSDQPNIPSMSKEAVEPTIIRYEDSDVTVTSREDIASSESDEMVNRSGGRNRKIKILKNDKVMNLKATYSPPPGSTKPRSLESSETRNDEKPLRKIHGFTSILRLNDDRKLGVNQLLNKTLALKQRSKNSRKNSDYENIKDFVLDTTNTPRRPIASPTSTQQISLPIVLTGSDEKKPEEKETGRLLSSSPLFTSFETYLKSILAEEGILNAKIGIPQQQEIKNVRDQNHHATDFGSNFAYNLNQFIPPSSGSGGLVTHPGLDSSQLSKRTFNELDFRALASPSPPVTENYFDHLLGQLPTLGGIGSPSAAGATLNNIYAPLFPPPHGFDISSSGTNEAPSLAPGSIPLDLASSFIQAGSPFSQSSSQAHRPGSQFGLFGSGGNNPFGGNGANGEIGTLTTSAGQPPTYNTISQGINLLNMISGTYPNTYFHDQIYDSPTSPTNSYQQDAFHSPSQFHIGYQSPATGNGHLSGYNQEEFLKSIGAIPQNPTDSYSSPLKSHNYHPGKQELHRSSLPPPRSSPLVGKEDSAADFSEEETDQIPAASSFSQSILTTFQSPLVKKLSPVESSTLRSTIALLTKSRRRTQNNVKLNSTKKTQEEPKSFSFEILPGRGSRKPPTSDNAIDDTLNSLNVDGINSSLDNYVSGSKSKKKASVSLEITNKPSPISITASGVTGTRGTTLKLKGINLRSSKNDSPSGKVNDFRPPVNINKPAKGPSNGPKPGFFTLK